MDQILQPSLRELGGSVVVGLLVLFLVWKFGKNISTRSSDKKWLPGPRPWPIVGNLPLLSPLLHQDFAKLSERFRPIFRLRLGSKNAIVITSPTLAEEVLKKKEIAFGSRAATSCGEIVVYNNASSALSPYGSFWRHARKVYTLEFITVKRIRQSEKVRKAEVLGALDFVINRCKVGNSVHIDDALWTIIRNSISGFALRKSLIREESSKAASAIKNEGFECIIREVLRWFTAIVVGDFIPSLQFLDIGGQRKQMKEFAKKVDGLLETIIEERLQSKLRRSDTASGEDDELDFLDVLLTTRLSQDELQLTREQIKSLILEVFGAGIESQVTTLSWAFAKLLKNPSVLARAQAELDTTIGRDRMVNEADLPHLQYLRAVVNETFRLHPAIPLLIPHRSSEATTLGDGYYIPKDTLVFVNTWAMGRDQNLWENPLEFKPERFLETDLDTSGNSFKFLPFGAGRRSCPGKPLAMTSVVYTLAVLLHACDWSLPEGVSPKDVDMTEKPGVAATRQVSLEVVATPRLPLSVIFAAQQS